MSTIILRTVAPLLVALMLLFSVFVLLRGHNEPGGGFIGGLIAAAAFAIHGIARGPEAVRRAMRIDPNALAGVGLALACVAGLLALPQSLPLLTGLWAFPVLGGIEVALSTVLMFDAGVYLVVVGSLASIALTLEEAG